MEVKTIQEAKAEIGMVYKAIHQCEPAFGEVDDFVLQALLASDDVFEYDAFNHAIQLGSVGLDNVPTAIVITYGFNHCTTLASPVRLTINAKCGGYLTPLCHKDFNHTDKDGLKQAIDTLYVRAKAIADGTKAGV